MLRRALRYLAFLIASSVSWSVFVPASALAAEDEGKTSSEEEGKTSSEKDEAFGHQGQFGLRAGVVGGLTMVIRYEGSGFCKEPDNLLTNPDDQQKFCGHASPFALDLGLSFGVFDFLEPFAWARLGLTGEEQTDTDPMVLIGAGVRLYTMSDAAFKIFVEPAVALELEDGQGHYPWNLVTDAYETDIVFHLAAGPQIDFARNIGLYVTGGVTTGVVRSIHASLDLQLGLQGRYP